jgi:hypothetical protein
MTNSSDQDTGKDTDITKPNADGAVTINGVKYVTGAPPGAITPYETADDVARRTAANAAAQAEHDAYFAARNARLKQMNGGKREQADAAEAERQRKWDEDHP